MPTVKISSENDVRNEVTVIENEETGELRMQCAKGMWCNLPTDWDERTTNWNNMIGWAQNHVYLHDRA